MNRIAIVGIGLAAAAAGRWWWFGNPADLPPSYRTAKVERGDLQVLITSTGTLQAMMTVQVGTQISGVLAKLSADFNDRVREGQVVAQLDPTLLKVRLAQDQASLARAHANIARLQVDLDETQRAFERQKGLFEKKIASQIDLDTAKFNLDAAAAQMQVAHAEMEQAKAAVLSSEINLGHATITSPISGIVISRSVDVGQTVAASLSAPTLFTIANDLSKMWVLANVDEADIGRVREGQSVRFDVDAFPERDFQGRVRQIRLQPTTVQNVVMYTVVIDVDNPEGLLLPGMTANLSILVESAKGVLRAPNAALRFQPLPEGGPPPGGFSAGGAPPIGMRPSIGGPGNGRGHGSGAKSGKVYLFLSGELKPVEVKTGRSDGAFTEIVSGELKEGDEVVLGTQVPQAGPAGPQGRSPWTRR